jgi:hypothetical protein
VSWHSSKVTDLVSTQFTPCLLSCLVQFVLAVGATQLSAGSSSSALCSRTYAHSPLCSSFSSHAFESVCSADTGGEITSGGGFSNLWRMPLYQQRHVRSYLSAHSRSMPRVKNFFNRQGRGSVTESSDSTTMAGCPKRCVIASILFVLLSYPDVSGFGTAFVTINAGEIVPAAGTSASVPLVASMMAMR